jgi:molecular chaperone HscB
MTSQSTTRTLQVCRNCGGGAPVDVHFCPQCSQILTIGRHGDYFAFLGVPRKLNLDAADLEQRFRTLSRQFHPDYFYNATPAERRASLERSSYLNDAYRTLKNPIARVEYLLGLEGFSARGPAEDGDSGGSTGGRAAAKVPAKLLEEVFALNEELDEVRSLRAGGAPPEVWRAKLERARAPIEAKQAAHEAEVADLSARWDALGVERHADGCEREAILSALRDCVLERNYITNLLEGIERELTQ